MYFSILQTSMYHLNSIVPSGFEVNQPAEVAVVAGGYKMATEFLKTLRIA